MKKNKVMCAIIALIVLISTFVPVTAFAATSTDYDLYFEFKDLENHRLADFQKEDDEQKWVVSLYNNGISNMSSTNILGLKMNRTSNNNIDVYHRFSQYVTRYGIPYQSYVAATDYVHLGLKKDDASTSSANLIISGMYNP